MTSKLALQWLPCQEPGVIGSALGLVGPVSAYCDWVRWKVWSAASVSVWQHVKLSVQIRPWDTLACCWDDKQPTNKQTVHFMQAFLVSFGAYAGFCKCLLDFFLILARFCRILCCSADFCFISSLPIEYRNKIWVELTMWQTGHHGHSNRKPFIQHSKQIKNTQTNQKHTNKSKTHKQIKNTQTNQKHTNKSKTHKQIKNTHTHKQNENENQSEQ